MKVKVIVDTLSRFECEVESTSLEECLTEAKMDALGEGDFISQKAEYEILEPNPPEKLRVVPKPRKPPIKPFQRL